MRNWWREELAWAAGFFDGEGSCTLKRSQNKTGRRTVSYAPYISVAQVDRQVLDRFQAAVGGLGIIRGPYIAAKASKNTRPCWQFATSRFEHSQAIVALLWEWLSPIKRGQIARVFLAHWEWRETSGANFCHAGHDLRIHGVRYKTGKFRRKCLVCVRVYERERYRMKQEREDKAVRSYNRSWADEHVGLLR